MTDLQRIERLFQAAADLPAEERAAYLDAHCESSLRARVDAMLARLEEDESLAAPIPPGEGDLAELTEGPGTVIGRYKLLQVIGEGGFGVVYMAEQTEPVARRVALKIIKLGMDTREVVARFEAERQALALMEHPNIASVLDGGATETGRPYFVMELVRGVSITEYCDKNNLTTRERLELFLQVCHAVQHAHHKGVIHRDIKPTNVMVTLHDGKPVPKVIDFGVAKAMHTRLTEKTLFTHYERFIGTPAYMSPEQAELSGLGVDTRTDVYSLGVLLYELLTGTTPFDPRALLEEGLGEIQRVIREETPVRPSIRISTTGDASIAGHRRSDVPALSKLVRGDLDWIVMKCLEKERVRRYDTVSEIAADVQRHLERIPVLAGPPSAIYRTRKFLSRNRAAAASVSVVLLVLIGGIIGTSLGAVEAARQRDDALESNKLAEREAAHARAVTDFLVEALALADPEFSLQPDVSVAKLLETAAERLDEGAFEGQERAEARVRGTIGKAFHTIGAHHRAARQLDRAVELANEVEDYDQLDYYSIVWTLTHVLFRIERPDALGMGQHARDVGNAYIRSHHPELGDLLIELGAKANAAAFGPGGGQFDDEIRALFEQSVRKANANLTPGVDRDLWLLVADAWMAVGFSFWYSPGEPHSADMWLRAFEVQQRELEPNHPQIGQTVSQLVGVLNRAGRADEAEEYVRGVVDRMREVLPEDNYHLAYCESMLGDNLVQQGRFEEAEELLLRSHASILKTLEDPGSFYVTDALCRVIGCYVAWGREDVAAQHRDVLAESIANAQLLHGLVLSHHVFGPEHAELLAAAERVKAACGGMSYTSSAGRSASPDAGPAFDQLVRLRRASLADDDDRTVVLARLLLGWAKSLDATELPDVCRRMVEEALVTLTDRGDHIPFEVAGAHAQLADLAFAAGDADRAAHQARRAWSLLTDDPPESYWLGAQTAVRVGRILVAVELYEAAEQLLVPSLEILTRQIGPENPDTLNARALVVEMYEAWGKPERAAEFE